MNRRQDAIWIAVVVAIGGFVILRASGRALDPIIDAGRDLYIPEQIRAGTKLYRDILYYYPPLAPYLLAATTAMVGSNLSAYTGIGAAIALATAAAIYAAARITGSAASAGTAGLLFVSCSLYSISGRTSNYLFPYAHAATLAVLFFMSGAAFLLFWAFKDRRAQWPAAGLLFLLLASWTKLEFALYSAAVVAAFVIVHKLPLRMAGGYVVAALVSLLAVDRYFADARAGRHWLFNNVLNSSLLHGESARRFYRSVSGFDQPGRNLWLAIVATISLAAIVLAIRLSDRWTSNAATIVSIIAVAAIAFAASGMFFRAWAIVQLLLIPFALRRPREPLLILLLLSLCVSSRIFLRMTPEWYGFVFLVPAYVLIAHVAFDWLPSQSVYSLRASRIAIVAIAVVALSFLWKENAVLANRVYPIRSPRGLFHDGNLGRAATLDGFIELFRGMKPHSLVVIPEGLTLNYLTMTPTPIAFHTFTQIETADPEIELQIMADLAQHPPEYIAVVTRDVTDFGYRGFGVDYNRRLAAAIGRHYKPVTQWQLPSFKVVLFRITKV